MEKRSFMEWMSYVARRPGRVMRLWKNCPKGHFLRAVLAGDWMY